MNRLLDVLQIVILPDERTPKFQLFWYVSVVAAMFRYYYVVEFLREDWNLKIKSTEGKLSNTSPQFKKLN